MTAVVDIRLDTLPIEPEEWPTRDGVRTRRMVRHFAAMGGGVVAITVANLLLVPVLYRHLGPEAFGVWALFAGVQVMLIAFDVGNALVHQLAPALAVGDRESAGQLVSGSLAVTIGAALVLFATFATASIFVDWASVWNVHGALAPQARTATQILVLATAVGLPAGLADRMNLARQMGGRNGLLSALSAVATVIAALIVVHFGGSLVAIVAATTIPAVVIRLLWLASTMAREPSLRPSGPFALSVRLLLRSSLAFMALQICAVVSYNSDQVVVARLLGPTAVASYAVPAKAFGLLVAVTSAFTSALWPAFLEAVARRDTVWLRRQTARLAFWVSGAGLAFGIGLVVLGPSILRLWVGGDYSADPQLVLAFACWGTIYVILNVFGFVAISLGGLRPFVVVACLSTVANLALSITLTKLLGVSGAVWGSALSFTLITALPTLLLVSRGLRRVEAE